MNKITWLKNLGYWCNFQSNVPSLPGVHAHENEMQQSFCTQQYCRLKLNDVIKCVFQGMVEYKDLILKSLINFLSQ